ncbi:MAG: cytochrome c biogenesis protein [Chloroflexi bacterium]|nr:cytochrome c biogenesis protein [Chloroflexota bacterium]
MSQPLTPRSSSSGRPYLTVPNAIGLATLIAMVTALYLAFVTGPVDAVQGIHSRIFYIHVPIALMTYVAFGVVFVGSVGYLWTRKEKWDRLARVSAEVGVILTTLTLITGSLWGRPVWGAFWSWSDARLITTLVLWLIYIAYLMLRSLGGPGPRTARLAAVLGILGFVDVPITYFSVYLWTYLHPLPTLFKMNMPGSFMAPFFTGLTAFSLLYVYLMTQRYMGEKDRDALRDLRARFGE